MTQEQRALEKHAPNRRRIVMSEHERLVERLRSPTRHSFGEDRREAADALESLSASLAAMEKREEERAERLVDCAESLAAAISLLERGGKAAKEAAPSDKMFYQMLCDYRNSLERARTALQAKDGECPSCGGLNISCPDGCRLL